MFKRGGRNRVVSIFNVFLTFSFPTLIAEKSEKAPFPSRLTGSSSHYLLLATELIVPTSMTVCRYAELLLTAEQSDVDHAFVN